MGPRLPENASSSSNKRVGDGGNGDSDDENALDAPGLPIPIPEDDGWRIGYEVHMEGIGLANVYDVNRNSESSDDGTSTDAADEDDSDNEAKRAGYRPLLADAPAVVPAISSRSEPSKIDMKSEGCSPVPGTCCTPSNVELPALPKKNECEIPHKPVEISLTEESISEIKAAMSSMKIPHPPEWAATIGDKKLAELVHELKKKM